LERNERIGWMHGRQKGPDQTEWAGEEKLDRSQPGYAGLVHPRYDLPSILNLFLAEFLPVPFLGRRSCHAQVDYHKHQHAEQRSIDPHSSWCS